MRSTTARWTTRPASRRCSRPPPRPPPPAATNAAWCSRRSPRKRRACSDRDTLPIAFRCPAGKVVANLNTDMFLPLFPLKSVVVQGLEESDLASDLKRVARPLAIEVLSDPEPERNAFVRSDQYSFIKTGVPALSLKVGFTRDSAEHQIVKRWRTERYHAPSDDLDQPIDRKVGRGFRQGLSGGRRRGGQPADAAAVERRQLLQAVRQVSRRLRRCADDRVFARAGLAAIVRPAVIWWSGATVVLHEHRLDRCSPRLKRRVSTSPPAESAAVRTMYKKVGLDPDQDPSVERSAAAPRAGKATPFRASTRPSISSTGARSSSSCLYGLYDFSKVSGAVTMRLGARGRELRGHPEG